MGPKKRGTRSSKRAEASESEAVEKTKIEESVGEDSPAEQMETTDGDTNGNDGNEAPTKIESEEESTEPPTKKSKVSEDEEEEGEVADDDDKSEDGECDEENEEEEKEEGESNDNEEGKGEESGDDDDNEMEEDEKESNMKKSDAVEKAKPKSVEEDSSKSQVVPAKKTDENEEKEAQNGVKENPSESKEAVKKAEETSEQKDEKKADASLDPEIKRDLDKFWKAVKDDETDFTGWTYLLQFVDSKNIVEQGREAYNSFLHRYPFCYGYWKKFADFEKRNGSPETCEAVFSRGMEAIPFSVDLWIHYINYVKATKNDDLPLIRATYCKAIKVCGKEFRFDKLYDSFLKFENDNNKLPEAYEVHKKILNTPTMGICEGKKFDQFRNFIKGNHPKDLMSTEDFLALRKEILEALKEDKTSAEKDESLKDTSDVETVPGEEKSMAPVSSDEETTAMREKLIFSMKKIYKRTEATANSRYRWEHKIKRPYFHVKPLERSQLQAWNEYVEYLKNSIKEDKDEIAVEDLIAVFERGLIACALYEEFWLGYLNWLEEENTTGQYTEKIRKIYKSACTQHLPKKVDIHIRWAVFEEVQGDLDHAAVILEKLEATHPELTSVTLRRAHLERRRDREEQAVKLYEACIKATQDNSLVVDCAIKFARYLRLHLHDTEKAKEVISKTIEANPTNSKLRLQMLDIMLHALPMDVEEIEKFLDETIAQKELKASHRQLFSQRKLEILEDFGTNMKRIQSAHKAHDELVKELRGKMEEEQVEYMNQGGPISTLTNHTRPARNGTQTYAPVANTASYQAQHSMAYQNAGARFSSYPTAYPQQYPGYAASYSGY